MSMTWMFRRDPPRHVQEAIARQAGELMQRFCGNADRRMMRSREEAFLAALNNWVYYAMAGNRPQLMRFMKELERLIRPSVVVIEPPAA